MGIIISSCVNNQHVKINIVICTVTVQCTDHTPHNIKAFEIQFIDKHYS